MTGFSVLLSEQGKVVNKIGLILDWIAIVGTVLMFFFSVINSLMQSAHPRISWHPGHWCAWCRECKYADDHSCAFDQVCWPSTVCITFSVWFTGWRYRACWWPFVVPVSCPTDPRASWIEYLLSCFCPPSSSQQIEDVAIAQYAFGTRCKYLREDKKLLNLLKFYIYRC